MDGKSLNILSDKLNKLKEIVPEAFTEDKVDWEKLKAAFGDDVNFDNERYNLNWAGKSDAFRVLQQRTPATLIPIKDESVNFDNTENVFIEGENLEVLKVLQKSYFGKIKMIYIDPPYNTGNDSFIYPDKFSESKDEYLKRIGDKSEEGYLLKEGFFRKNSKDSGHYHSNWLTMMYPRLYIARNLLKDDGVIFVSIDDNEVHNLRMIMNEIFGEENFIDSIIWKKRYGGGAKEKYLVSVHEYALFYAKDKTALSDLFIPYNEEDIERYYKLRDSNFEIRGPYRTHPLEATKSMDERKNLVYGIPHPDGSEIWPKRQWLWSKERAYKTLKDNELEFLKDKNDNWTVHTKQYLKDDKGVERLTKSFSIIDDIFTQHGTNEFINLFENAKIFSFPKPSAYVKNFLNLGLEKNSNDIVLDFFAGSGTTAQAVLEINKEDSGSRKFILVQLPEKIDESSEAFKAGYKTIAEICKERIRRVVKKLEANDQEVKDKNQTKLELSEDQSPEKLKQVQLDKMGCQVFKLSPSNFKHWRSDLIESQEDLNKMIELFDTQLKPGAQELNMLYELMLKSGYTLTDKIEEQNGPSSPSGEAEASFYLVADKLAVVLSKIDQTIIDAILKVKPQTCIILDNLFADNDQLKTNTSLQFKDSGIEFVTI